MFRVESGFSATELAYILAETERPGEVAAEVLAEAQWYYDGSANEAEAFIFPRIVHTLGSAVEQLAGGDQPLLEVLAGLEQSLQPAQRAWLETLKLSQFGGRTVTDWSTRAKAAAFEYMGKTIIASGVRQLTSPRSALRGDEIVWGRAPARLELAGGWTDTPPYTLERGGCVLNAAVNINGQPPIQAYARVIDEPVIRIGSIDLGLRIEVTELDNLLDYGEASSGFALAKAALALSGLSPERAAWPAGITLKGMLEQFGGGIELTTLAAIPKGSGLGTSSIMGAVVLAVIQRVMGRVLTAKELFHLVLQLEQALTTGGGWQDQIGGAVDGVKLITTESGMVPDAMIHFVPSDVLDPRTNGGATLLYYVGMTRLAKNILQEVVGEYLDRDRLVMSAMRRARDLAPHIAEAMSRKSLEEFGRLIELARELTKDINPNINNEQVETLLARVRPHLFGARLLGAGGGGFLLMICKSPADAQAIRDSLNAQPPNDRARFFDFNVSKEGLVVTVC